METAEQSWYLRDDEGAQFGPVDLDTLARWASEGRIAPGHAVSTDGRTWRPAETLPRLSMHWMVELADGTCFGPLHIGAARVLADDGVLRPGAAMLHRVTGERRALRGCPDETGPRAEQRIGLLRGMLAQLRRAGDETARRLAEERRIFARRTDELQQRLGALRQRLEDTESGLTAARDEMRRLRGEATRLREELRARDDALAEQKAYSMSLQNQAYHAGLRAGREGRRRAAPDHDPARRPEVPDASLSLLEAQAARELRHWRRGR